MALLTLGEFLWSLLVTLFMVVYFMMIFYVIVDVFRRRQLSGVKKAAWLVFLLVLPLVGLISYVALNGDGVAHRNRERAAQRQDGGIEEEIERGKELLDSGAINQAEYEQLKSKALA